MFELNVRALNGVCGNFTAEPLTEEPQKREKQLSTATTPPCFWFFRCRVDVYFKKELKHSKRFVHVTDDVMSLLVMKKFSGRTLPSCKFSLPCDKRLTLYSPRPSFPTFSLMFITRLNFKCQTSTGYF